MTKTNIHILRGLMLFAGIIFILAGLVVLYASKENINSDLIFDNLVFFISGGMLIFLRFTWKNKEIKGKK